MKNYFLLIIHIYNLILIKKIYIVLNFKNNKKFFTNINKIKTSINL